MARSEKLTLERVDRALAKLAKMIILMGDEGECLWPIFDRVEQEREKMASRAERLQKAIDRVK
ncbi:hypothetical protein [Agrobacterium sp.]|uniref:hypothetical protein n=1 Tax=Agrobacterium sp. TaxID=361 RepID=UPI0028B0DA60